MQQGTLSVKLNDSIGPYFQSGKGVRQGDPLSPFLFNLAADTLAKMIKTARQNRMLTGLIPEYIDKGIVALQYADDTIICLQEDKEIALNLKLMLYLYERMSGLKINFQKSELLMIKQDQQKTKFYAELFNCAIGEWPIKYLGVPVSHSKLHVIDWAPVESKLEKRLDGWQEGCTTLGGRKVLIDTSLSSIPIYHMSMYLIPKTNIGRMDKTRKRFFWQGGSHKKKLPSCQMETNLQAKKKGWVGN